MLFYVRDRRNIVPRKPPTDVAQKENLKANANGNRTSSTFNQGSKETVQNGPVGPVEKQLSSATPAAVIRKDASNGVPSMAPPCEGSISSERQWPVTMAEKGFCIRKFLKGAIIKQTTRRTSF
jgi:ubiquitin carboxyl-terminal hydrolase 36/42